MGFKTNSYSTVNPPTDIDAHRFGEKVIALSLPFIPTVIFPLNNH